MADRDRYDWERGRDADRDREYGRSAYGRGDSERIDSGRSNFGSDREYGRGERDRGVMSRGADEVRSWFGDDEARRRREMDERFDRTWDDRGYGANSARARAEHGWSGRGSEQAEPGWSGRPYGSTWDAGRNERAYGDQRDFIGRGDDWSGSAPGAHGSRWPGSLRDVGDEDMRRRSGGAPRDDRGITGEGRWTALPGAGSYGGGSQGGGSYGNWSYGGGSFGAGAGSHAGRGPRNYQRSDERVREDVNERLTIDPRIDASDIDVRVQNGEVTLSGQVEDRRTRRLAEEIIEDLPGVRDVRNELRVNQHDWGRGGDTHRQVGEQSRQREDGSIGHGGDPQKRDDMTIVSPKDRKQP